MQSVHLLRGPAGQPAGQPAVQPDDRTQRHVRHAICWRRHIIIYLGAQSATLNCLLQYLVLQTIAAIEIGHKIANKPMGLEKLMEYNRDFVEA